MLHGARSSSTVRGEANRFALTHRYKSSSVRSVLLFGSAESRAFRLYSPRRKAHAVRTSKYEAPKKRKINKAKRSETHGQPNEPLDCRKFSSQSAFDCSARENRRAAQVRRGSAFGNAAKGASRLEFGRTSESMRTASSNRAGEGCSPSAEGKGAIRNHMTGRESYSQHFRRIR